MKKTGILAILVLFLAFPGAVADAAADDCALGQPIADLKSVRTAPAAEEFVAIRAELRVRKAALREVVNCLVRDAESLRAQVQSSPGENEGFQRLQARIVERLDGAKRFYQDQARKIDDLGIGGSQQLARTLREWRASTFSPLQDEAVAFVLWTKNQELLAAAQSRFDGISRALKLLNLTEDEDIATLLEAARKNLEATMALNKEAGRGLLAPEPGDASLTRIKTTLASLQDTYKSFFELSGAVEKILPR